MGEFKDSDYPPYNMYSANMWYEKAANAGNIRAAFLYGVHLLEGSGCAQDIQKAIQYFEFGAKNGHIGCMYNLGIIYHGKAFGSFFVDENKAGYWFNMAAQNGDKQAMEMLNMYKYSKLTKRWSQKI